MPNLTPGHRSRRGVHRVSKILPATLLSAFRALVVVGSFVARPTTARAQVVPGSGSQIGGYAADRARLDEVAGDSTSDAQRETRREGLRGIAPSVFIRWNSDLPAAGNDGALWSGRGLNFSISGGLQIDRALGTLRANLTLSPEMSFAENRAFQFLPGATPGRSGFSSPWHAGDNSADIPLRFGDRSIVTVGPGQSALTFSTHDVAFGVSSANEWWGPALRNTLVLSNNAAGIPRLFVRAEHPLRAGFLVLDPRLIAGALTESPYFDGVPGNDARSISGLLVTVHPAMDPGLTVGLSRLVIAPIASNSSAPLHAFDVLTQWHPVASSGDTLPNGRSRQRTDQIFSLFSRWVFPASGVEVYGEWARTELPRSLREFLEAPQSTQAYTVGGQVVRSAGARHKVRFQAEAAYLEQTFIWPDRPTMDYYAGRAAIQGFTQRGQVLGAAIGPGSSNQFLAVDLIAPSGDAGAFVSRTRTEDNALYRLDNPLPTRHDVTLALGVRGARRLPYANVSAELVSSRRLNYLFQSEYNIGNAVIATDVPNFAVTLRVEPH